MNLITTEEAATRLLTTPETIRKYIRDGRIRAAKIGKHFLISEEELNLFVERQCDLRAKES